MKHGGGASSIDVSFDFESVEVSVPTRLDFESVEVSVEASSIDAVSSDNGTTVGHVYGDIVGMTVEGASGAGIIAGHDVVVDLGSVGLCCASVVSAVRVGLKRIGSAQADLA